MAIAKTKDGRWYVAGRKGYWPDEPRRTRQYFGRGDAGHLAAIQKDSQLQASSRKKRRKILARSILFEHLAGEYLEAKRQRASKSTIYSLEYLITSNLGPAFGDIPAIDISADLVDRYVNHRLGQVSATTVNSEITYLIAILNWGADPQRRRIAYNPLQGYKKPKRDDARIMPPTADEFKAILENSPGHLKRALVISYFTGIRPGPVELFSLRFSDVDWGRGVLFVRSARKGGPADRLVPIHLYLYDCLNCWYEDDLPEPGLIVHYRGQPVKKLKTAFANAKRKAGITRRIRPYDFRHANISGMMLSGVDPRTVSELAGHSRPDTTTRIYTHSNLEAAAKAIGMIDNPFAK